MKSFDESVDKSGMKALIESWGVQVERSFKAGLEKGGSTEVPEAPRALIWAGMGGSAIGGDYCAALASDSAPFPILVHRGGPLPEWVGERDRIVLVSFSGNTAETLDTAEQALSRKCGIDVLTSGGKLADWAKENNIDPWMIEGNRPPRAALGDSFAYAYGVLCGRRWCKIEVAELEEMDAVLAGAGSVLGDPPLGGDHPLAEVFPSLESKMPMIYGTGILAPVARRWANQINENSKLPAHWGVLPEMNHNEVVAYTEDSEWAGKGVVIILEDQDAPVDVLKRIDATRSLAEEAGWDAVVLGLNTQFKLGRMLALTVMGDWLSYWMAVGNGVDPTPIGPIDKLKQILG